MLLTMVKTRSQKPNGAKECKPVCIRLIDRSSKTTALKNGKSGGKNRVQTRSALKAQSKVESTSTTLKEPIEAVTNRVQPKRIKREQPKQQSNLNPI